MQIDSIRLFVTDLQAARQFYAGLLDLPLVANGSDQGYCVFRCGALQLVLEAVPPDAPADDQALVGRFTGLPERQFWGGILATFCNPSGNQLQIVQRPAAG